MSVFSIDDGKVVIDERIDGSVVQSTNLDSSAVIVQNGGTLTIAGGSYILENGYKSMAMKLIAGTMNIQNAKVDVNGLDTMYGMAVQKGANLYSDHVMISSTGTGTTYGIYNEGYMYVRNVDVTALSDGAKSRSLYVTSAGTGEALNSSFKGLCTLYQSTSVSSSQGINNAGDLRINNCYAWGSHSGVTNSGKLVVKGGIYESPGHGGFYFGNIDAPAYVHDAIIRHCDEPKNSTSAADYNECGFYIGGGSGRDNINVYIDNCDIYADVWAFTLRGSSNEKNNSLYISNSRISGEGYPRVDNETHKLYLGSGNNFTEENVANASGVSMVKTVIKTNDRYRY